MLTLASPVIVANVCLSLCIASSALLMLLQRELFPFSALSLRRLVFTTRLFYFTFGYRVATDLSKMQGRCLTPVVLDDVHVTDVYLHARQNIKRVEQAAGRLKVRVRPQLLRYGCITEWKCMC